MLGRRRRREAKNDGGSNNKRASETKRSCFRTAHETHRHRQGV